MANVQLAVAGDDTTQVILSVPGVQGPTGISIPPSGTTHQVLYKQSSTDYDTAWKLITNDNVDAGAEIAVSKLADGSARQLLQTDAAGTGVEWTSNVDIPGTLDVTSAATFDAAVTTTGLLSASGKISVPLASGEGPSIYFGTDTDTGIYSPGANQVALSTSGTGRLFVDAGGAVSIGDTWANNINPVVYITKNNDVGNIVLKGNGGTSNALAVYSGGWSGSNQVFGVRGDGALWGYSDLRLGTGSTYGERLRIDSSGHVGIGPNGAGGYDVAFNPGTSSSPLIRDSSGRLLVGTSSDSNTAEGFVPLLQVASTGAGSSASIARFSATPVHTPRFAFKKSASGTLNTNSLVSNTDALGGITFEGSTATGWLIGAQIEAVVDGGTPGSGSMPGRLVFSTTPNGSTSPTPRMTISNNGVISVGTTSSTGAIRLDVRETSNTDTTTPLVNIYKSRSAGGGSSVMEVALNVNIPTCYNNNSTTGIKVYSGTALEKTSYAIDAEVEKNNNGTYRAARFTGGHGNIAGSGTQNVVDIFAQVAGTGTNGKVRGLYVQNPDYDFTGGSGDNIGILLQDLTSANVNHAAIRFYRASSQVGSIVTDATSTAYNTSSDYRLKENIVPLENAITRLKGIPVHRFNFIQDSTKTVDGFLAHEVQPFVPEAVTGTKDEVILVEKTDENNQPILDQNGNPVIEEQPVYQAIDQSKLVPLLTAALQEAIGEIESLKARLSALETP